MLPSAPHKVLFCQLPAKPWRREASSLFPFQPPGLSGRHAGLSEQVSVRAGYRAAFRFSDMNVASSVMAWAMRRWSNGSRLCIGNPASVTRCAMPTSSTVNPSRWTASIDLLDVGLQLADARLHHDFPKRHYTDQDIVRGGPRPPPLPRLQANHHRPATKAKRGRRGGISSLLSLHGGQHIGRETIEIGRDPNFFPRRAPGRRGGRSTCRGGPTSAST
jgi:hypothetical protein